MRLTAPIELLFELCFARCTELVSAAEKLSVLLLLHFVGVVFGFYIHREQSMLLVFVDLVVDTVRNPAAVQAKPVQDVDALTAEERLSPRLPSYTLVEVHP